MVFFMKIGSQLFILHVQYIRDTPLSTQRDTLSNAYRIRPVNSQGYYDFQQLCDGGYYDFSGSCPRCLYGL